MSNVEHVDIDANAKDANASRRKHFNPQASLLGEPLYLVALVCELRRSVAHTKSSRQLTKGLFSLSAMRRALAGMLPLSAASRMRDQAAVSSARLGRTWRPLGLSIVFISYLM